MHILGCAIPRRFSAESGGEIEVNPLAQVFEIGLLIGGAGALMFFLSLIDYIGIRLRRKLTQSEDQALATFIVLGAILVLGGVFFSSIAVFIARG
ncbi:hypothetical protein C5B42_04785 [Candidatus Cerribacteria bacterium 'Amazon FNV 2010 28 9']|uniref:DUF4190 domain-containing protein n=1 Tax=Candidatus Cerribacteria bacterium 'Amazon FNV 2010 28 9' TaxID=2081795 RepID=A0A317JN68_9BACT|nr:MAG: hypothetical protein C5B42_04785 [Candidatus Cerribacteria bacterium 'Amazon FNV 2010 28 9']